MDRCYKVFSYILKFKILILNRSKNIQKIILFNSMNLFHMIIIEDKIIITYNQFLRAVDVIL